MALRSALDSHYGVADYMAIYLCHNTDTFPFFYISQIPTQPVNLCIPSDFYIQTYVRILLDQRVSIPQDHQDHSSGCALESLYAVFAVKRFDISLDSSGGFKLIKFSTFSP
jgi:hypothetical protein